MATAKRDNRMGRGLILLSSVVAAAGFWLGAASNPITSTATSNPAQTAQAAVVSPQPQAAQLQQGSRTRPSVQQPQPAQQAQTAQRPRLRTRGS